MHKEIYILTSHNSENYKAFQNRIMDLSQSVLKEYDPETLKTCLTHRSPPPISVIPFKRNKIAAISVTRDTGSSLDLIKDTEGFIGAYRVNEAIPVAYEKTWKDGHPTPGVCLLTLFHKKPGLDQETFIHRWHQGHTPLSLRLHPLWNYNRNVVISALKADSIWYDGIVEEHFQKASDLLNPMIFFGPPLKMLPHMYQVLKDTRSFIDMKRIETYLCTEFHLKSQTRS